MLQSVFKIVDDLKLPFEKSLLDETKLYYTLLEVFY